MARCDSREMKSNCGLFARTGRSLFLMQFISLILLGCFPRELKQASSESNASVPRTFDVTILSTSELAGKIKTDPTSFTVLNVWATWCPPCLKELPEFARFYNTMDKANVRLLSVVVMSDPEKSVKPILGKHNIPFPVYYAAIASPDELVYVLDLDTDWDGALPATFVLDKEGRIIRSWFEEVSAEDLFSAVTPR